jgi:hypothetical protein
MKPPSIRKSLPVMLPARSEASQRTSSATSSGREKRPVTVAAFACATTSSGVMPATADTVSATPPPPSHSSVSTGPGLTVLTRMPFGPTSFDSALEKATSAALPAL